MQYATYEGLGRLLEWMGLSYAIAYFWDAPRFEAAVLAGFVELLAPSILAHLGRKMDQKSDRKGK